MVWASAGNLPEQNKSNECVNRPPGTAVKKYAGTHDLPCTYEKDILFLFCGRRSDRIKGLVWEGDGFLLLYKRLELGGFSWPRTKEEALEITPEQYRALMQGLEIVSRHPIQEVQPSDLL